jgi:hypothetical protein
MRAAAFHRGERRADVEGPDRDLAVAAKAKIRCQRDRAKRRHATVDGGERDVVGAAGDRDRTLRPGRQGAEVGLGLEAQAAPRHAADERSKRPGLGGTERNDALEAVGRTIVARRRLHAERGALQLELVQRRDLITNDCPGAERDWLAHHVGDGPLRKPWTGAVELDGNRRVSTVRRPGRLAVRPRRLTGRHDELGAARPGVAAGDQAHRQVFDVGPFQQRRYEAAALLADAHFAIDRAFGHVEADVGGQPAVGSIDAIALEDHSALREIGRQDRVAAELPVRIDASERRRQMKVADLERIHVDADRQPHAAAAVVLGLFLARQWRTQHRNTIGADRLDEQSTTQQRREGPAKPCVLYPEPRSFPIGVRNLSDGQIGREKSAQA